MQKNTNYESRGIFGTFVMGLGVLRDQLGDIAESLLRKHERRSLAKRLDEEYRRLGRLESGPEYTDETENELRLVNGQIALLRQEIETLDAEANQ